MKFLGKSLNGVFALCHDLRTPVSVVRRRPSQSEAVVYLENRLISNDQILQLHPQRPTPRPHWT